MTSVVIQPLAPLSRLEMHPLEPPSSMLHFADMNDFLIRPLPFLSCAVIWAALLTCHIRSFDTCYPTYTTD